MIASRTKSIAPRYRKLLSPRAFLRISSNYSLAMSHPASYPLTFTLMPSILLRNLTSYTTQSELKRRPSKHRAKRLKARLVCRAAKKPDKKLHPLLLGAELLAEYLPNRLHFRAFSYATVRNRQFAKIKSVFPRKTAFQRCRLFLRPA